MRVLVTGGHGNIGSSAIPALLEQGDEVHVLELESPNTRRCAQPFRHRVTTIWGDVLDADRVADAVRLCDVVLHLVAILPPNANADVVHARRVNVAGVESVIAACKAQEHPPRLLFTSSFAVFGPTTDLAPPRRADDPLVATDAYSRHKIEAEDAVARSGLEWSIVRFPDVPPLAPRSPDRMMFEIPLETRFETMHTRDAGRALAAAVRSTDISGRVLLLGGGRRCQVTYGEYIAAILERVGIGALPASAFATRPHYGDWLDSTESQERWRYQTNRFSDVVDDIGRSMRAQAAVARVLRPVARQYLLRLSPYYAGFDDGFGRESTT
jgi:UDP-glucose 4-epimerase